MDTARFDVGKIACWRLIHGRARGSTAWMFPDVPAAERSTRMAPYLDGTGTFEFVSSSMLVDVAGELVLLDTSLPAPRPGGRSSIVRHLDELGVHPDDIGTVIVTHAHPDHVGGLARHGDPVFGRARHVIDRRELAYWTETDNGGIEAESLSPLLQAGLFEVVDGEHGVLPGLTVVPTPGHTPGHLAVAIDSGGEVAIYVGDVLAHEVNLVEPGWNHFSDMAPLDAARSRRALVAQMTARGAIAVGSHLTAAVDVAEYVSLPSSRRPGDRPHV